MFESLSMPVLLVVFVLAAAIVWLAGIHLARATDVLAVRWGLGEALGGLVVLAIVTNLPEIAIVASGATRGDLDLATGNLLGGIAVQTVVLVLLDGMGKGTPLTSRASSPALIIEGVLVMAVLAVAIGGAQLPADFVVAGMFPPDVLIVALWLGGLLLVGRLRSGDRSEPAGTKRHGHARRHHETLATRQAHSTWRHVIILLAGGAATFAGGVALEATGQQLAGHWQMDGLVFGATVLALATSLPEISTGWASVRLGDDRMAISDIFGGNAFLPVLFLQGSILSGAALLPQAGKPDLYLAALGLLLTAIYVIGLAVRSPRRIAGLGWDSLLVLVCYGAGVAGLLAF